MKKSKRNSRENSPLDRRDFIKTGAAAAAVGTLAIDRAAFAQSSETVKVALIGCGGRGSGAANQALSTNGDVKLVAMADAFKDRMDSSQKGLQRAHGLKAVSYTHLTLPTIYSV